MMKKAELIQMEQKLCNLYGESDYQVIRRACTGDYRGHYDYSIVFASGQRLYVGLDRTGYERGLPDELAAIQHFRSHQTENTDALQKAIQTIKTDFVTAQVQILPHMDNSLCVWAGAILTSKTGLKFKYRETGLHYALTRDKESWYSMELSIQTMLKQLQEPTSSLLHPYSLDRGAGI